MSENRWLLSLIRDDMYAKQPLEEDIIITAKPKSKIQEHLQRLWEIWRVCQSPDALDKYYEEYGLESYHHYKFEQAIMELAKKVGVEAPNWIYDKEDYQKIFFQITEAVCESGENRKIIKDYINSLYPNLCSDFQDVAKGGVNEQYQDYVKREVEKIKGKLESGDREGYEDKIQQIEKAKKTEIEKLAVELNRIIILGREIWELILYSVLSPYSPPIKINNLPTRPNLHFLTVGDVSTAKTKADRIVEIISPKALKITKSTEASFEGVKTPQGDIEEGIIDQANQGVLIIPEFTRVFEEFKILREVMDCDKITLFKGGIRKDIFINITFFAGCNPKDDFFQDGINLREQIAFKDGVLTRMDVLIPLMATAEKNEFLLDHIDIFGTKKPKITLEEIHERLETLAKGMVNLVTNIYLSPKQKQMVKQAFLRHNKKLKNRPLLILRDLETLCRIVNVIATTNFPHRKREGGLVKAENSDIEKAVELWEEIIAQRKILYTNNRRLVFSLKEKILMEIARSGNEVKQMEIKNRIVSEGICSARTVERKINDLLREGRIIKIGERNGILKVA